MTPVAEPIELRNLDSFEGRVMRGVSSGDPASGLEGCRVAIVGGAMDVAGVIGPLARGVTTLKVFQQDPAWLLPVPAASVGRITSNAAGPLLRRARSSVTRLMADRYRRRQVPDSWVRRQLRPTEPPTRATVVYSSSYYRALRKPNVELVTWPVTGVVPRGIRTADGLEHVVDAIVLT